MRPTGGLHLGHYHGVLKNWVRLQHEHECLFFVADWHALTTHYDSPEIIQNNVWEMVIDWLAAGVDPNQATLFIQSQVPEHAELHLLLSMITPLGWLERIPTYKDQQGKNNRKGSFDLWFPWLSIIAKRGYSDLSGKSGPCGRGSDTSCRIYARNGAAI
jgi:Tryptophanyl-tRNA synthetase